MENVVNYDFWKNKNVLVTGNTGFKGSWLTYWLNKMGANVFGFALSPIDNSLFNMLELEGIYPCVFEDIRNYDFGNLLEIKKFDVIFHLAAQPLVIESYKNPQYTWSTNVMGTINLFESIKKYCSPGTSIVCITTDKVYQNNEWDYSYRESDVLGGDDPYSASKSAMELVVDCWRKSFFDTKGIKIASARAGNVIGGGDVSVNRIVPDMIRSLSESKPINIRNPTAVRPWQHVLEPLSGYLILAQLLHSSDDVCYQSSFNFGPFYDSFKTVKELIESSLEHWEGVYTIEPSVSSFPEHNLLFLSIEKSIQKLKWKPRFDFKKNVQVTVEWYKQFYEDRMSAKELCDSQIDSYMKINSI